MKHSGIFISQLQVGRIAVLSIALILLASCQSDKSTVGGYFDLDTDLKISFEVAADINPDELGSASPLFIRFYEIKAKKIMSKADFIDLYERDKEVLGADLVTSRKLKRFKPGESREEHFVLDKNTKYIALYAEFLDFKESDFSLVIPVVTNNVFRNKAVIKVTGNTLVLKK